jgi:HlyD family secretion protein
LHKIPVRLRIVLALVVLGTIAYAVVRNWNHDGDAVRASGIVEMDETDVASLVGGRVVALFVGEGDSVRAGDTLAVLDRGELAAEVRAQLAQAERAAAQSAEVREGPRAEEIQMARADLASADAELALAEKDFQRARTLLESSAISQAELDRARSRRDALAGRRRALSERLRLLETGNRREQVRAAREGVEAARAQLTAARSRLGELVLVAPVSGVVLLKNFETGELAQPGQPVVTLGNPDSLWMRVYVGAPAIERVQLGAPVEIRLAGISKHVYRGRVVEIATRAEFTPRAALTEEERANLVFGVKLALEPSGRALKAGLPADARIRVARRSSRV